MQYRLGLYSIVFYATCTISINYDRSVRSALSARLLGNLPRSPCWIKAYHDYAASKAGVGVSTLTYFRVVDIGLSYTVL